MSSGGSLFSSSPQCLSAVGCLFCNKLRGTPFCHSAKIWGGPSEPVGWKEGPG